MIRLYVEPEAEEELEEAAARYEAAVPGLGQQFVGSNSAPPCKLQRP